MSNTAKRNIYLVHDLSTLNEVAWQRKFRSGVHPLLHPRHSHSVSPHQVHQRPQSLILSRNVPLSTNTPSMSTPSCLILLSRCQTSPPPPRLPPLNTSFPRSPGGHCRSGGDRQLPGEHIDLRRSRLRRGDCQLLGEHIDLRC